VAAACRKVSSRARVAWHKRNIIRNKRTRAKDERGIRRERTLGERVRTYHEGRNGVKNLDRGRPRYLKKRDLKNLRLESMRNVNEALRKATGPEIAKRIARSTVGLRTIKDRNLWTGRKKRATRRKARRHKQTSERKERRYTGRLLGTSSLEEGEV
jgi:hypothetical protein